MTDDTSAYAPTPKLRFVNREGKTMSMVLQQWFAPDVPKYMVDPRIGEWRDVPYDQNG